MSDKKFRELKIDEELRDLLPPLTEDEYKFLEDSIKEHGCTSPIHIWNEYVVDGHNRYGICKKYNYGFEVVILDSNYTKDDIIEWMIDTQLGRRNLTNIQRIEIAEKYRKSIEKRAEENMSKGGGDKKSENVKSPSTILPNPITPIDTRKELAKIAGVSEGTYNKGKKILESNNEELKQKVKSGEIKINTAYNELFPKKKKEEKEIDSIEELNDNQENVEIENAKDNNKTKTKICLRCGQNKNIDNFYIGHEKCKECEQDNERKVGGNKEVFRDTEGNPLPITEEGKINNDEFQEMLKDIKTSKSYEDSANPKSEIEILGRTCDDLIWQIDAKIFSMNKLIDKMGEDDIDMTIKLLDSHIVEINKIKNKLNDEKVGR